MKYVSKEETNGVISGGTFRFSKKLINIKPFTIDDTQTDLSEFKEKLRQETREIFQNDFIRSDLILTKDFFNTLPRRLQNLYDEYYLKLYDDIYSIPG